MMRNIALIFFSSRIMYYWIPFLKFRFWIHKYDEEYSAYLFFHVSYLCFLIHEFMIKEKVVDIFLTHFPVGVCVQFLLKGGCIRFNWIHGSSNLPFVSKNDFVNACPFI